MRSGWDAKFADPAAYQNFAAVAVPAADVAGSSPASGSGSGTTSGSQPTGAAARRMHFPGFSLQVGLYDELMMGGRITGFGGLGALDYRLGGLGL